MARDIDASMDYWDLEYGAEVASRRSKIDHLAHQRIKLTAEGKYSEAWVVADEWQALRNGEG